MIGWWQAVVVIVAVGILHVPLGDHLARVYTSARHSQPERAIYRLIGVSPEEEQSWGRYLGSLLAFSMMGVLVLYGLLLLQTSLPQPWGHKGMNPSLAFNTAVSFTTNTSWQNYAGESTLGHVGPCRRTGGGSVRQRRGRHVRRRRAGPRAGPPQDRPAR
jgi:K+-transporting ATPase, A chain